MSSWFGSALCVTGPFCRWITPVTSGFPSQRASNAELWCFRWCSPWTSGFEQQWIFQPWPMWHPCNVMLVKNFIGECYLPWVTQCLEASVYFPDYSVCHCCDIWAPDNLLATCPLLSIRLHGWAELGIPGRRITLFSLTIFHWHTFHRITHILFIGSHSH